MKKLILLFLTIFSVSFVHSQDFIIMHNDTINVDVTKFYKTNPDLTTFKVDFEPYLDLKINSQIFSIPAKQIELLSYQGEALKTDELIEKINLISKKIPNVRLNEMREINLKIKTQEAMITGGVFIFLSGACLITNILIQDNNPNVTANKILSVGSGAFLVCGGVSFIIGGGNLIQSARLR